ncbi:UNVERIFIED_CONTAM: hypothetical protein Slati_2708400 [Sesamum latifolium]|uniref:Uncharacterized protein n=1 Tax=Sesamum latifolium TaxID=2727402 RepID=A0AAW2VZ85_9LAMI
MQLSCTVTPMRSSVQCLLLFSIGLNNNGSTSYRLERLETFRNFDLCSCINLLLAKSIERQSPVSLQSAKRRGLNHFNATALEVPSTTQEVKSSVFSEGLLDGDCFKSLAKKPVSRFDSFLAKAKKYINMDAAQASKNERRG